MLMLITSTDCSAHDSSHSCTRQLAQAIQSQVQVDLFTAGKGLQKQCESAQVGHTGKNCRLGHRQRVMQRIVEVLTAMAVSDGRLVDLIQLIANETNECINNFYLLSAVCPN